MFNVYDQSDALVTTAGFLLATPFAMSTFALGLRAWPWALVG